MKLGKNKRGMLGALIALLCAVILACTANLAAGLNASKTNASALSTTNAGAAKVVSELTVSGYNSSSNPDKVFSGTALSELYDALTNTTDGSATINKVENLVSATGTRAYASHSIPDYMNANDIKTKYGYNIIVNFGGIAWDVVFLTRDSSGDLIMTLWADQLVGSTCKFGWATSDYTVNINSTSNTTRISNAYGTSQLRAVGLNGGPTTGGSTYYSAATTTAAVALSTRQAHPLANFTLDNSALGNGKSLINYLVQPKDLDYTYYLSWTFLQASASSQSHILNDALTLGGSRLANNSTNSGTTTFYASSSHCGGWWNQGVKNYALGSANGYNDWATDYVWAPSLPETSYTGAANEGLWGTRAAGQNQYGAANTNAPSSALSASTNSANYAWLRSGNDLGPYYSVFLSSSGGLSWAYAAASLGVRPALHLNLTSAASAAAAETIEVPVPQAITEDFDGLAQSWSIWEAKLNGTQKKYPWIDLAYHNDASVVTVDKIEYKSYNSAGVLASAAVAKTQISDILHAGEYDVTLKIDTANTKYRWRGEDETVDKKTFKVKINQLNMNYTLTFYDQSNAAQPSNSAPYTGGAVSVGYAPTATPITGANAPNVTIYHKGNGNNFGASDNGGEGSTTGGVVAGNYAAHGKDSATESDYKLVPALASNTLNYTITKKQVTLPSFSGTYTYSGSPQQISLPTSGASGFDPLILNVTGVTVTATNGSSVTGMTFDGADTYSSGGKYQTKLNLTGSSPNIQVTDAGTYSIEFGLVDTGNTEWAAGVPSNHASSFTVGRAPVNVGIATPGSGFTWQVGTSGNITVTSIGTVCGSDSVTVELYWYKSGAASAKTTMHTTGMPDTTGYAATNLTDAGTYYICAVLANDSASADVNRNYFIDATDANTGDTEVQAQQVILTAGTASMDNVKWQYKTAAMVNPADVTGATLSYDTVGGTAVTYTLEVSGFAPASCTPQYSMDFAKSAAGNYTAKVTLTIPTADRGNCEMPNPANGYVYAGEGRYTYKDQFTCEIEFDWTIEQKEIDLSNIPFEYSCDNGATWTAYNPSNPPEASGFVQFQVRVPLTSIANTGILAVTASNYQNQYGPGVIDFDLAFTLDSNYKAQSGQNQSAMPYSMTTTGEKIDLVWVRVPLKDSSGQIQEDDAHIPYYVYELDTTNIPAAALPYIKYEYYLVSGSTYGSIITGLDISNHQGLQYVIDPTGLNANSQNPVQVYVRAVLTGMTQINGVDPYVLVDSPSNPEYKKITVGDNRRAVDLTAGTVTSITYGSTANPADMYAVTQRNPAMAMPAGSYKVSLYLGSVQIAPDITGLDFSALDAGMYTLSFELLGSFDTTHVLAGSSLPFEIKPIELVAPTLKDNVTLTFNGLDQQLSSSLQNFDATYMEFAISSIHEAYHAGTYTAVINIKAEYAGNYVFAMPQSAATPTKAGLKHTATAASSSVQLSNSNQTAALDWTIEKFVFDTTAKNAWNFAKDGATLSFNGIPASIKALTMGNDPTLSIDILYYDKDGNPLSEVELKGGDKYFVAACLNPASADYADVEFKGQAYDPLTQMTTSPQAAYTVPKSGASAFLGNIKDFATKTWLGLPIWAWLAIALALIILLIIIIVVAKKRRKTKEEREAKKAAKEEEKQRKQEEKERREEERRMQQERLEAERELAKAKQEAELEKIRAQAGAAAGVGMASMAMQQPVQQPQQQPMQPQQPVQQQQYQPVQQVADNTNNDILREMREQMAELRADNRATQAQLRAMQDRPPQYAQSAPMPVQYAQPAPAAAPAAASADSNLMTLMDLKVQMAEMKSAQAVAEIKAAQAIAEAKASNRHGENDRPQPQQQPVIVMAPSGMGANYSPNYPNHGGYPSVNPGYGMQALPAPQQMMPPYGMTPYGYPPYAPVPPYGYPVAMLPQQAVYAAPAKAAEKEEEPVVTSTSSATPSMTMSQPPYCPPGAVMTTTTTIDTSKMDGKPAPVKRTAADTVDDMNFDIDGFYDPLD